MTLTNGEFCVTVHAENFQVFYTPKIAKAMERLLILAMQSTGQFPQLTTKGTKSKGKGKGKRGC